jgi:sulfotransferase
MTKQFYFLAGLPRSGNTLLSSILNQNPNIYSSPISPVVEYMWILSRSMMTMEEVLTAENNDRSINIIKNILPHYYNDVKENIIIERHKGWALKLNLEMIKEYITPEPKIIFTKRPALEILASYISLNNSNPYLESIMFADGWKYDAAITMNDNICNYLMSPVGQVGHLLNSLEEVNKEENKDIFCVVDYNDLVSNPKEELDKIYNFLNMKKYKHDFKKVFKLEKDYWGKIGLPSNIHEIRPEVFRNSKEPKDVLSKYILEKYRGK